MSDFEVARLDPTQLFDHPREVLQRKDFSKAEKREILERWRYDAEELQIAAEENMNGGEPDLLDKILEALKTLENENEEKADEHYAPTKHSGGR